MTGQSIAEWGWMGLVGLGVLTAIHPCPLSVSAASVLLVFHPQRTRGRNLTAAMALVAGRGVAYMLLAVVLVAGLLSIPAASAFLRNSLRPFLGPLLILAGMLQAGLLTRSGRLHPGPWFERRLGSSRWGLVGTFLLGMGLALTFCPASAGIFFGVFIPLAAASPHPALGAFLFSLGHGLPLLVMVGVLLAGIRVEQLRRVMERWSVLSGWLLIAIGGALIWQLAASGR